MLGISIQEKHIQEELCKPIKSLQMILIMMGLGFLCKKKILARLKRKTTFALTSIVMKTSWLFQFTIFQSKLSNFTFDNSIDFLFVTDESKSHFVCIKDFNRFTFNKTKNKKNIFTKVVYSVLVIKMCWQSIKKFVWALIVHNL